MGRGLEKYLFPESCHLLLISLFEVIHKLFHLSSEIPGESLRYSIWIRSPDSREHMLERGRERDSRLMSFHFITTDDKFYHATHLMRLVVVSTRCIHLLLLYRYTLCKFDNNRIEWALSTCHSTRYSIQWERIMKNLIKLQAKFTALIVLHSVYS